MDQELSTLEKLYLSNKWYHKILYWLFLAWKNAVPQIIMLLLFAVVCVGLSVGLFYIGLFLIKLLVILIGPLGFFALIFSCIAMGLFLKFIYVLIEPDHQDIKDRLQHLKENK